MHAALHLVLFGAAAACEELFDERGLELEQRELALRDGEEDHSTCVGHDGGGVGVRGVSEETFDGDGVGFDAFEQVAKVLVELFEACADAGGIAGFRVSSPQAEDAGFDDGVRTGAGDFHAAVASEAKTRVDAEDAHERE